MYKRQVLDDAEGIAVTFDFLPELFRVLLRHPSAQDIDCLLYTSPFHHRVISQVDKHGHMLGYPALLKGAAEEISHIVFDTHGAEHNLSLIHI